MVCAGLAAFTVFLEAVSLLIALRLVGKYKLGGRNSARCLWWRVSVLKNGKREIAHKRIGRWEIAGEAEE